ncbi:MAG: lytic transglycosylase domain-containing protein [Aliishimia sp.]
MQAVFRQLSILSVILAALTNAAGAQESLQDVRPQGRPAPVVEPLDAVRPQARPSPFGRALEAMQSGDWDAAFALIDGQGPVAADVIEWHRLRAGRGTFQDVRRFLDRRSDWPGLELLRKRSESTVIDAGQDAIITFFDLHPAQTVEGAIAHAAALTNTGQTDESQAVIVAAWRNWDITEADQALLLKDHSEALKKHHVARLDAMLWQGAHKNARRMFALVNDEQEALALARMALRNRANNADALIKKVPAALADDPGLAHARFEWRIRAGKWSEAKALLLERSVSREKLGNPPAWANRRRELARDELRDGKAVRAYQMASQHYLEVGSNYADLEWLAGYIALIKLNKFEVALQHFENHDRVVASPISQGRAGYWKGRTHTAMGNPALADMEYAKGAAFQTSFYGLLAAEAAQLPFDVGLADVPQADWRTSPVVQDTLFQAGLMLSQAGYRSLAERFWRHLAEQLDADDAALLGQAAIDIGEPHLAVMIGKSVARRGVIVPKPYYALHPLVGQDLPIATEMALAIARRESEFDPVVVSGAGAMGLMQLMPATAREVAGELGVLGQHRTAKLTQDPVYNAVLGTKYLKTLAGRFGDNVIMVSAGYNAGPSRPDRWMRLYGDPRSGSLEDMIDWIEGIPFRETRNYVMRVSESLPIYRARLGLDPLPVPFSEEIRGATLGK